MQSYGKIRTHFNRISLACIVITLVTGGFPETVLGDSQIVDAAALFSAADTLTSYSSGAWGVLGSNVAIYQEPDGLMLVDSEAGSLQDTLGKPTTYINTYMSQGGVWANFVTPDPSGQSFWVGFAVDGNSDDRIYQVDLDGNWTQKATLMGNWIWYSIHRTPKCFC